jgi:DNA-binding HxlR family transcriptional regulator
MESNLLIALLNTLEKKGIVTREEIQEACDDVRRKAFKKRHEVKEINSPGEIMDSYR